MAPKPLHCGHASCVTISLDGKEFRHAADLFGSPSPGKWARIKILRNDRIQAITTGGSGFGDPLDRDPELILQDVVNELVSVGSARDFYGVVIGKGMERSTLDREGTAMLRQ